jgi:hypothetical protein
MNLTYLWDTVSAVLRGLNKQMIVHNLYQYMISYPITVYCVSPLLTDFCEWCSVWQHRPEINSIGAKKMNLRCLTLFMSQSQITDSEP